MKWFGLLLAFIIILSTGRKPKGECFAGHLLEAIELNANRMERYAERSGGASRWLSIKLIASEIMTVPLALLIEVPAFFYWQLDIPIACKDFVSMKSAHDVNITASHAVTEDLPLPPLEFAATDSFEVLHSKLTEIIQILKKRPDRHCMVRHVLESAARISWLAPQYDKLFVEQESSLMLPPPSKLSRLLLWLHFTSLDLSMSLDTDAHKLHVGMICNDVPKIETEPAI